jgi:hypothetical protein
LLWRISVEPVEAPVLVAESLYDGRGWLLHVFDRIGNQEANYGDGGCAYKQPVATSAQDPTYPAKTASDALSAMLKTASSMLEK